MNHEGNYACKTTQLYNFTDVVALRQLSAF